MTGTGTQGSERFDVIVVGEALVEISARNGFHDPQDVRLAFSGDALNAAAAAVRAGAEPVALLTRTGDDVLGRGILRACEAHGVETRLARRVSKPNGAYFVVADPNGSLEFVYLREGSAASTLNPEDVDTDEVRSARALLVTGVTAAISASSASAVDHASRLVSEAGGIVVYDPNFRRKLTTSESARRVLETVAPRVTLVTPSCPGDSVPLLGTDDPEEVARRCRELGAGAVAVTLGADGVLLDQGGSTTHLPGFTAPRVVDATGAGDVLTGVVTARLALGDELTEAIRLGMAAATLSVGHQGGAGDVPSLEEISTFLEAEAV
jgi:2-dehydro-3-deoxygluconokinase